MPLGNRDLMRAMNRSLVLNLIKTSGPIARAEVARRSGLSPATISGITAELIEDDLIFEKETGDSSGGRRPILLALNPHGGYVVGLKLTETQAIGALTDLEATVVVKSSSPLQERTPEDAIQVITRLVDELMLTARLPRKKLLGVGVGLAGIVDSERGLLRQSPFFHWHDVPLRDLLQERLSVPIYIENDVNTLSLAEKWFGMGQGIQSFLTITVGRGVGMGIVVNGQFYSGVGGGAGEFGHTIIDPQGPLCNCGKRGCLEAYVGDQGLVRMAQESLGSAGTTIDNVDALLELAQHGDPAAAAVFGRAGKIFGQSVANLITLFNPECIIIGGEGVCMGEYFFGPMRTALKQHVLPDLLGDTEIHIEPWGDDAWARGAASLVLRELFESPVLKETQQPVDFSV